MNNKDFINQFLLNKIKEMYQGNEKFRQFIIEIVKKNSPELFPSDSIENMLLHCRELERGSYNTIYKLIARLNMFSKLLIEDNRKLIQTFEISDPALMRKIGTFKINDEKTLFNIIQLFYESYLNKYKKEG